MSLKYGLNTRKGPPVPVRKPIFDDEEGEDVTAQKSAAEEAAIEEISTFGSNGTTSQPSRKPKTSASSAPPPPRKKPPAERQDISSAQASKAHIKAAAEVDPSIFDYDSFHDAKTAVSQAQKEAERQDAIERKPKYIGNLLDAAARRKQDQLVAREKLLQKERENEGDEFADKDKFVTGAYKAQQEEARKLEEEEKRKAEAEEERRRKMGGGMQGFYKGMMDHREKQHQEAIEAAEKAEKEGAVQDAEAKKERSDAELAAEAKAKGVNVHLNEDGQITDKRELLAAGLNVGGSGASKDSRGADHLLASNRAGQQSAFASRNDAGKHAQRERQSKLMEEQLATQAKRAREEEEEERRELEQKAKSQKTAGDVSDAKARYLARKAAKERGEG